MTNSKSVDSTLLDNLLVAAPNWVAVQTRSECKARLLANPPRASEAPTRDYSLSLEIKGGHVSVREESEKPLLPTFCPQRHMNPDGSFCLGLNAGRALDSPKKRRDWWKKLLVFLTCQDTAAETRTWPPTIEISHGQAGQTEVIAEDEAEKLGLLEEYQRAVRDNQGFIAAAITRVTTVAGRLRNARAACVCGRKKNNGQPKLRRDCRRDGDVCLPIMEARRRREEREFWEGFKGNRMCCGTMDECPLK